jgi:hypothetical protein
LPASGEAADDGARHSAQAFTAASSCSAFQNPGQKPLEPLSTEINLNMGLLGINRLAEMSPELLLRLKNGRSDAVERGAKWPLLSRDGDPPRNNVTACP